MARDFYEVLGVSRTASQDEIQQAYRKLARRHHPDVNKDPSAEERFKDLNEAYSVLSDPKTRARYDRFGEDFRKIPEDYDERVAAGAGGGFRTRRTTGAAWPPRPVHHRLRRGLLGRGCEHRGPARVPLRRRCQLRGHTGSRSGSRTATHRRRGVQGWPPNRHTRRALR